MIAGKVATSWAVWQEFRTVQRTHERMKENCIKLMEHPNATVEQLMQAHAMMQDVKSKMHAVEQKLQQKYPQFNRRT